MSLRYDLGQLLFIDHRSTMEANSWQESMSAEDFYGLGIVRFFFVVSTREGYGGRGS